MPVRDAKGLVQIYMTDVGPDVAGTAESDLGVHVGAIHVNLAAIVVDDAANFGDGFLEDAVGRGIGDHEGGEVVLVRFGLGAQVGDHDISRGVAGDGDDAPAGHGGAGGVGAVGGGGDEADAASGLAAGGVIFLNDKEAGVFALRAGIGLEGTSGQAADFREPLFQLPEKNLVAARLRERGEGMQLGEGRPGNGQHFGGAIQFHGAGAERDHRCCQR
jgi:hypothetical protein